MDDASSWPTISLVTAVFNSAKYIEATMRSVLSQDYPRLEYTIVDGGSTDGTVEIIRKYASQLHSWSSEPDRGMYDALNKGFARTSGEIMGWINASDALHLGGLKVVGSVFRQFPEVAWITGRPTILNEEGMTKSVLSLKRWARWRFLAGANRYIQQESTFWRRSLWDRAGGRIDDRWGIPSDFGLWVSFFRHAQLYAVDALIGEYRLHADAQGWRDLEAAHRIHDQIIDEELASLPRNGAVQAARAVTRHLQAHPKAARAWRKWLQSLLLHSPGADLPPVICDKGNGWAMRTK